ncbi:MAG: CoA transferase [Dehalococcoidia bacterium]|nr:MAG: CoA transferase [Dehalococcoidia bacterium]
MAKALEGIRVLDLTRMYGGPFCTMLLAELGAEVIKVEIPEAGDGVRNLAPQTEGQESYPFVILNRGKLGVTLNLDSEAGRNICRELVGKSDVLIENFTPGVTEKLGLSYEQLQPLNPKLIYASISGFGQTGPSRTQVAFDTIIQAMGGLVSVNGQPDSPPTKVAPAIADFLGGVYAIIAILAALQYRSVSGLGQQIDISMQDSVWAITAIQHLPVYLMTGQEPPRLGNRMIEVTPFNIYPAKDGYVVIAIVTVGKWERLLGVLGREDLKDVPEYRSQVDRVKHMDVIDSMVEEWSRERTVNEIVALLRPLDLPCSAVPTFGQVTEDPQLASREMQVEVEQLISGKLKVPGSVFKMSETPGDPSQPAPFVGQHNAEVYSSLLGYDSETIDRLQREGVI